MKTNFPEIDFVILTLNRVESTIETLKNVLWQQNITPHIFVVDQGSNPDQLLVLEQFIERKNNIHLIKLHSNVGVAKGRDIGIKAGTSKYIIELDNDAVFLGELDAYKTIEIFQNDEQIAVVGYEINNYFTNMIDPHFWVYPKSLYKEIILGNFQATRFCGAGHAIRRIAYQDTDGYDHSLFFYWEELDLSYQLINLKYKILFTPNIKILHKVNPDHRLNWKDKRYYYLVRNSLYLQYKYFGLSSNLFLYTIGYFLRGARNNVMAQYFTGVQDSLKMIRNLSNKKSYRMTPEGKKYIYENDLKYRGNIFNRFFKETFVKLK